MISSVSEKGEEENKIQGNFFHLVCRKSWKLWKLSMEQGQGVFIQEPFILRAKKNLS